MRHVIKKGNHRTSRPRIGLHFGKTSESYEVTFHESCRYDLHGYDQQDWNKLFGWSYGYHHSNSIRLGWRYSIEQDYIELCAYTYKDGVRKATIIGFAEIEEKTIIHVALVDGELWIFVDEFYVHIEPYDIKPIWGYDLGLYFGGNMPAPHKMEVTMKRLS